MCFKIDLKSSVEHAISQVPLQFDFNSPFELRCCNVLEIHIDQDLYHFVQFTLSADANQTTNKQNNKRQTVTTKKSNKHTDRHTHTKLVGFDQSFESFDPQLPFLRGFRHHVQCFQFAAIDDGEGGLF